MPFIQGWEGYLGIGVQGAALDTSVAATDFADLSTPDVSLRETRPNKAVLPALRNGPVPFNVSVKRGVIGVEGGFSGPLYPDDLFNGLIFALLLGNNNIVVGDAGDGFTHTFSEPTGASDYPAFGSTIEVFLGGAGTTKMRDFLGCFLNKITITAPEDDVVNVSTEWFGHSEVLGDTKSTPTFTDINPFESWMVKLEIGATLGAVAPLQFTDLTFEYTKNVIMAYQKLNCTRTPVGRTFGIPEALLSFNVKAEDAVVLQNLFKNNTEQAAKLILKHTELSGSNAGSEYEININIPRLTVMDAVDNLDALEDINQPINMTALKDDVLGYTVQVTSKNSVSGTYTV